jgi:hypothetical protein
MKRIIKTFGESLEQLELSKLRIKYEKLGYNFEESYQRKRKGDLFQFDAYAKHPVTKDEIIFEIKSKETIQKGDTERILSTRDKCLSYFPRARFIIVLAKEAKEPIIVESSLNFLLKKYIEAEYLKNLKGSIKGFMNVESVDQISFEKVNFNNFESLEVSGYGNLKFWLKIDYEQFKGRALSDGTPFEFHAFLTHNPEKLGDIYVIDNKTVITFDLSEFR